jgi:hypothetical protein
MNNIEKLLRKTLTPNLVPDDALNEGILKQAKEIGTMRSKNLRHIVAAAEIIGILAIGSVSTYAAYHFLTPSQVADTMTGGEKLSIAFAGDDAMLVNETQRTGGYNVTFLGTVTGKALILAVDDTDDANCLDENRTYAVVAIEKDDGSPMPEITDDDYQTFCVSALIHGKQFIEANNGVLNAGVKSFVQNGVQYELYECDNLEIFSKMGVSLGVVETFGQETSAFIYDSDTGLYSVNPDYDKMNALFDLPLDISKADDEAANNYFKEYVTEDESETDIDIVSDNLDVKAWIEAFSNAGNSTNAAWDKAMANATEDTSQMQISDVDESGYVSFSTEDGENIIWFLVEDWSYDVGVEVYNGAETDGTLERTRMATLSLNLDGTFTLRYYVPNIE